MEESALYHGTNKLHTEVQIQAGSSSPGQDGHPRTLLKGKPVKAKL